MYMLDFGKAAIPDPSGKLVRQQRLNNALLTHCLIYTALHALNFYTHCTGVGAGAAARN